MGSAYTILHEDIDKFAEFAISLGWRKAAPNGAWELYRLLPQSGDNVAIVFTNKRAEMAKVLGANALVLAYFKANPKTKRFLRD